MSGHQRVPDASDAVTSDYVEQASAAVLSLRPVAKLVQNTDRPNSNRSDADTDAECRVRTGDDPAHASADYSERNEIGEVRVAHAVPSSQLLRQGHQTREIPTLSSEAFGLGVTAGAPLGGVRYSMKETVDR